MTTLKILDYILFSVEEVDITVRHFFWMALLLLAAHITYLIAKRILIMPYFRHIDLDNSIQKRILKLFYSLLISLAFYANFQLLIDQYYYISKPIYLSWIRNIFAAGSILFGVQLLIWSLNQIILQPYFRKNEIDVGRQYTVTRLILYLGFTIGIILILQAFGLNISILLGGSAALLVGVGLGLQQTFNDLVSGIIILIEGTIEVGDIVRVDDTIARVKKIGLRTSEIETRDRSILIIPNSKLVVENVDNWSHNVVPVRFQIKVGVAYSSDVKLVKKLLLEAASTHPKSMKKPKPRVQFNDFGNSSLDFTLHFFSRENMHIEDVKSDIRFNIIALFRENGVEIPFPQQDLWIRNPEELKDGKKL